MDATRPDLRVRLEPVRKEPVRCGWPLAVDARDVGRTAAAVQQTQPIQRKVVIPCGGLRAEGRQAPGVGLFRPGQVVVF